MSSVRTKTLDKLNTAEMIVETLRADILQGKRQSKRPLKQDEIAAEFGVSKIPVREALSQLKTEGLVTFAPNRGAFVSALSPDDVDEIYTIRIALETVALARAIPNLTIGDLNQAEAILALIDQEKDITRWGELNWEFHTLLYAPANMPRLLNSVQTLHVNVARYLVIYLAGLDYQTVSQQEHHAILQAVRQGDVDAATTLLKDHLKAASNKLITFLNQLDGERL
ncbi:MAG: GntR family transcriptional regulator [Chloroflexota bacterium]